MKKQLVESEMGKPWVTFNSASLSMHDKEDPSKIKFDQSKMRHHLAFTCFESNNLSLFPVL